MFAKVIFASVLIVMGVAPTVLATPETHQETLLTWIKNHALLQPLKFVEKLKVTDPDFESQFSTSQGTVYFSANIGNDEFVEYERIQYRPSCFEADTPGCQGMLQFESKNQSPKNTVPANPVSNGTGPISKVPENKSIDSNVTESVVNGQNLIKLIWGNEILEDFLSAKLMMTDDISGVKRWYQGRLYNYETWHFRDNINAHFAIVSKRSPQAKRIEEYKACLKEMCQYF